MGLSSLQLFGASRDARKRANALFTPNLERSELRQDYILTSDKRVAEAKTGFLAINLIQAGLPPLSSLFVAITLLMMVAGAIVASQLLVEPIVPLFALGVASLPWIYIQSRKQARSVMFASEYPTVLLAMASSMKSGMTPYLALERATKLLPKSSLVRTEIDTLLQELRRGGSKAAAVAAFGKSIALPELALFRSAFLLVLEHGGRFAPTLDRLARVSRDRMMLVASARASTTTMRMTANFLLIAAPLILLMVSLRTDQFLKTMLEHPVANSLASIGFVIIAISYGILQKMSSFKP